jgi:hypothetical protein
MAVGYGNAASLAFAGWTGLTDIAASAGLIQSIASPGWTRQVADITPIDLADGKLRQKLGSGRLEQNGITVSFFYDPDSTGLNSPILTPAALTLTYPVPLAPTSVYVQTCIVSAFSIGNIIDDEISVCECEFMPTGNAAGVAEDFNDPTAA